MEWHWYIVSIKHNLIILFPITLRHGGKARRSKLTLTTEDRAKLGQLARSRTVPKREAQRLRSCCGITPGKTLHFATHFDTLTRVIRRARLMSSSERTGHWG
jgi:hypothetical protein